MGPQNETLIEDTTTSTTTTLTSDINNDEPMISDDQVDFCTLSSKSISLKSSVSISSSSSSSPLSSFCQMNGNVHLQNGSHCEKLILSQQNDLTKDEQKQKQQYQRTTNTVKKTLNSNNESKNTITMKTPAAIGVVDGGGGCGGGCLNGWTNANTNESQHHNDVTQFSMTATVEEVAVVVKDDNEKETQQVTNGGIPFTSNTSTTANGFVVQHSPGHSQSPNMRVEHDDSGNKQNNNNNQGQCVTKITKLQHNHIISDHNSNTLIQPKLNNATDHQVQSQSQKIRKNEVTQNQNELASKSNNRKIYTNSELYEEPPYHIVLMCYLSYVVLIVFGYLRDFMRKINLEKNKAAVEKHRDGYSQLYKNFESFYTRNIYRRIRDCWNRPIAGVPGAYIDIIDRVSTDYNWTFENSGKVVRMLNMGSYNYLGFAENSGPINKQIIDSINRDAIGVCSVRNELGTNTNVAELESIMAKFLGVESSIVFGMGFATNSTNIQCLVGKGCLIVSDELNHASLILGCRLSGATTRIFKHNDMNDLERKIRKWIVEGQPKTRRPWKKIIILVEGIYSMEGTIINLPELIRIKKRYKCYVYLDEAHSIGALGPNGRGVVDYYNCDPNDVDILMGTYTKSFGAAGGYIAGRKRMIDHIRASSYSTTYANSMSPVIAQQIICVIRVLMGLDGTDDGAKRIERLARNTRYFRKRLNQMGFIIYGNDDSPVVPLMLCFCPKIAAVCRLAYEKKLGFIGAGFPATSLTTGRVRFCISASHTKEMLDHSLEVMSEIGDQIEIKYSRKPRTNYPIIYEQV